MLGTFDYVRARSVEEACRFLKEHPESSVLAGGTDLLVELRNRLRTPDLLIDIKGIEELRSLEAGLSKETRIGAGVSLNVIAENRSIRERYPALSDAAVSIGTYQLRNRGTLVGNLCNASPAADGAPPLLVLEAEVEIASSAGTPTRRWHPIAELFTGVKRTTLKTGELITQIRIPDHEPSLRTAFLKQQRIKGHDLAVVNAAASFNPETGIVRLSIGSCSPTPALLDPIDTSDASLSEILERAMALTQAATSPISDVRASAEYRKAVLPVLIRRLLERLLGEEGGV